MGILIALPGCYWTRLLRSKCRQPWLKADLEKYKPDYDSDEDNVKIRCGKGKKPFITLLRDIIQTS
jgi:hypothetical protein